MINAKELRDQVIVPTLDHLAAYDKRLRSDAAVNLLLCTQAHESLGGFHLKQVRGPALGIYQIEPETHDEFWPRYLARKPDLVAALGGLQTRQPKLDQLITNLSYATAFARLLYWQHPAPLPEAYDVEGLAKYWKKYYNTTEGHGSVDGFLDDARNIMDALL